MNGTGIGMAALFAAALCCVGLEAAAQGSKRDYERADVLRELTKDRVAGLELAASWSRSGDHLWFRRDDSEGRRAFLVVDPASGERRSAFDHAALAGRLGARLGRPVDAERLPVERLQLRDDGSARLFIETEEEVLLATVSADGLRLDEIAAGDPFTLEALAPEERTRSGRGGKRIRLIFLNKTPNVVQLFWLDGEGGRRAYGEVQPGKTLAQNTFAGHVWLAVGPDDAPLAVFDPGPHSAVAVIEGPVTAAEQPEPEEREREADTSPDGKWKVVFRENDAFLVEIASGTERRLTEDGTKREFHGGPMLWSPDGRRVVFFRKREGTDHRVHFVESSPDDQVQPRLHDFRYRKPGDELDRRWPLLVEVATARTQPLEDALFPEPWSIGRFHWSADGSRLLFLYNQRGHQLLRLLAVDAETAEVTTVIEERSETFIDYSQKTHLHHLDDTGEVLWMSERSGWNHLYLAGAAPGAVVTPVTSGEWVVRGVEEVDEEKRQVRFRLMGFYPDQDPYHVHHARVDLDGGGLTLLTEGDGTHELDFSPDGRFYVDSWSRVDRPPVHELRRSADGALLCELSRAADAALRATGWAPPERFVARGRDGETDIWGILHRPTTFDATQRYPIVEQIYAGPHGQHVPKAFRPWHGAQAIAELGFVVVQIDGMGTNWRSKAFHDVAWKNLEDAGFPDRIAWMQAAAQERPWMDLSRVGIYGGSAGGQNALRAVLDHCDFYRAAVADCGCHDNRMDKVWWNEAWMGWPVDESYARSSNVVDAEKLCGALLLTVGEMDRNVDPASTLQVVNALIAADKDFELIVFPGGGHGIGESDYGVRRRRDFFVRHLMGVEPRWREEDDTPR